MLLKHIIMKVNNIKIFMHLVFHKILHMLHFFSMTICIVLIFSSILIINTLYFLFKVKLEVRQLLEVFQNFTLINKLQL
jgi:hypothetical protein